MKILLDTHILLWSLFSPEKIKPKERQILEDLNSDIIVSAVSFWEISLKYALGKLSLKNIKPDSLPAVVERSGFQMLDLTSKDAASFFSLPKEEISDPFDRMLAWVAISNKMKLFTYDKKLAQYQRYGLEVLRV